MIGNQSTNEKPHQEVLAQDLRDTNSITDPAMFDYDKQLFIDSYSPKTESTKDAVKLQARLVYYVHKIEKGLSHAEFRHGFGKDPLEKLADTMRTYRDEGFDVRHKAYVNALSSLKEYIETHVTAGVSTSFIEKIYGDLYADIMDCTNMIGGASTISIDDKRNNANKNFQELFNGRRSVRDYAETPVDVKRIERAIDLSMKTPSVCNRQSSRVYIVTDPDVITKVSKVQISLSSYKMPPVLLVVTSDISHFLLMTERREPYIDGGMFAMSLMLSLEYEGLAACPFNAMFTLQQEKAFRELLPIKPHETIITCISVGNFPETCKSPKSFRYDGAEITTYV